MKPKLSHPLILLVEGNPSIHKAMRVLCEMFGFTLDCVSSAPEAINALGVFSTFDVILIDCDSLYIDGADCARQIRSLPHYGHIPIIALIDTPDLSETSELVLAGVQDSLHKPFTANEFKHLLLKWTHKPIHPHISVQQNFEEPRHI